jgi:hypothetical protein
MLVNLIGPPCAGKSYVASKYVLEHAVWDYVSIDACRVDKADEDEAWKLFSQRLRYSKRIIAESSGLSWRMPDILAKLDEHRQVLTLALIAPSEVLHERLKHRQHKRKIPYQLRMDEAQSINWVLQNLDDIEYPVDEYIRTDIVSKEELYNLVSEKIRKFRLSGEGKEENVI